MAVNTGFFKGILLSPLSLSCHLWKLSQHYWKSARWMASASDVMCSLPGWEALPGCCVTTWKATWPEEVASGLPVGWLSAKRGELDWAQGPQLSTLWVFHHSCFLSFHFLPTQADEILRNCATQIVKLLSTLNLKNLYKSLGPSLTLKAAHKTSISSWGISQPTWHVLRARRQDRAKSMALTAEAWTGVSALPLLTVCPCTGFLGFGASVSTFLRSSVVKPAAWVFRITENN